MNSILLVCMDTDAATSPAHILPPYGFSVAVALNHQAAHDLLSQSQYDIILVDLDLPRSQAEDLARIPARFDTSPWQGTGFLRELRALSLPSAILAYTWHEGELYETACLDAGADDVLFKRSSTPLLVSRLHAHLRRKEWSLRTTDGRPRLTAIGRFTLDRTSRILVVDQGPITLTTRQAKLLELLGGSSRKPLTDKEMLDALWGDDPRRSMKAFSNLRSSLRRKFEKARLNDPVENVSGQGFKLSRSLE